MNLSNVCIDADLLAKKDPGMAERKITDEDRARGARFKALRLSRGLTQEQVAERAKLPRDRVPRAGRSRASREVRSPRLPVPPARRVHFSP